MTVCRPTSLQFCVAPRRSRLAIPPETEGELEFELNREYRTKYPQDGVRLRRLRRAALPRAAEIQLGCGWPAFYDGVEGAIEERPDDDGSGSIEIICANCKGHLGHVFKNEASPRRPTSATA